MKGGNKGHKDTPPLDTEEELQLKKLAAEVKELGRPLVLQASFWFSVLGVSVAVATTGFAVKQDRNLKDLAKIELQNAEYEVADKVNAAKESVRVAQKTLESEQKKTEDFKSSAQYHTMMTEEDPLTGERLGVAEKSRDEFKSAIDSFGEKLTELENAAKAIGEAAQRVDHRSQIELQNVALKLRDLIKRGRLVKPENVE